MKIMKQVSSVIVRATLIVALVFGLVPRAEAQTLAAKGKPAVAGTKSAASAKPSGGPQEGIKVHGHWTIEVRNPNGTLASHTEFENALTPGGQGVLAVSLGRVFVVGPWRIKVGDGTVAGPCEDFDQLALHYVPTACVIAETGQASSWLFPNLTKTTPNYKQLVLSGSATAARPFSVSVVSTEQWMCTDPNISPNACASSGSLYLGFSSFQFTYQSLQNPISVVPGQIIQVTVVFSFS